MIVGRLFVSHIGQVIEVDQVRIQPVLIRLFSRNLLLEFVVTNNAALLGINQKHAARLQATLFEHPLGLNFQHPNFRGHNHQIIFGDIIA